MMTPDLLCYLAAFVSFLLAACGATRPAIGWRDVGYACLTLSLIV